MDKEPNSILNIDLEYLSGGCNPAPHLIDWGRNNLIIFGCHNNVIVYDPVYYSDCGKVIRTLSGHKKAISCLKWIENCENLFEQELVSASSDGSFILWKCDSDQYEIVQVSDQKITLINAFYTNFDLFSLTVITVSSEDSVNVWFRPALTDKINHVQQISLKNELCTAISSFNLKLQSANCVQITAVALTNFQIKLCVWNSRENIFEEALEFASKSKDWINSFSFRKFENDVFLLSSSQDDFVRLYRINFTEKNKCNEKAINALCYQNLEQKNINSIEIVSCVEFNQFSVSVRLETVICENEGSIYEINWSPKLYFNDDNFEEPLEFMTCSINKSIIIWQWDIENSGLWIEKHRLGQVGGNTLGFYGCKYSPNATSFITNSYQGSLHLWNFSQEESTWQPAIVLSGHYNDVNDICWDPSGEFLISASSDKTSRIHALWRRSNNVTSWHEISRPQIHGHSINCIAFVSMLVFLSGSEEKILRVFKAPENFIQNARSICDKSFDHVRATDVMPNGALVPSLGLSNQAVYCEKSEISNSNNDRQSQKSNQETDQNFHYEFQSFEEPPNENLLESTLWPEVQKLYAHGFEMYAVAVSSNQEFVASSCKSTTKEFATVVIWDVSSWKILDKLTHHNLTVTQLEFSPDSRKLLLVSRDRTWSLYELSTNSKQFLQIAYSDKTTSIHTRIIWCCSWSHDSKYFATGSRDGKVIVWTPSSTKNSSSGGDGDGGSSSNSNAKNKNIDNSTSNSNDKLQNYNNNLSTLSFKDCPITALSFAPFSPFSNSNEICYFLAIGFDNGTIKYYKWSLLSDWRICTVIDNNNSFGHQSTVKRLRFQKTEAEQDLEAKQCLRLASCSNDHTVRIFNIHVS